MLPLNITSFSAGTESDVCRRQILTSEDGPRTERIEIFIMVIDPRDMYSNVAGKGN